jgi:two-component system sensor histidine kinase DegS
MADQPGALSEKIEREIEGLEREAAEIAMLIEQARSEATRQGQRRTQAVERLAGLAGSGRVDEVVEASDQVAALTRRAAVMEAQVDVLAGKQATLERYRDSLRRIAAALREAGPLAPVAADLADGAADEAPVAADPAAAAAEESPPVASRAVLAAQEDLRREISRAMHDGPAQSLANIVLQAQIVDRLIERDPTAGRAEVRELVAMVQRTLEATKSFIFDLRPMVLDDLGIVPTLRRAAGDRSRRARVPIAFESLGADRRLPMDLESAVFRVAEEALAGLAGGGPEKVALTLDWQDAELAVTVEAVHPASVQEAEPGPEVPEALRAMIGERRAKAAAREAEGRLSTAVRRELEERAAAAGGRVEIGADGRSLTARFPLPEA